jgi:hypothetical protein
LYTFCENCHAEGRKQTAAIIKLWENMAKKILWTQKKERKHFYKDFIKRWKEGNTRTVTGMIDSYDKNV